jgi:hypothetical protein
MAGQVCIYTKVVGIMKYHYYKSSRDVISLVPRPLPTGDEARMSLSLLPLYICILF